MLFTQNCNLAVKSEKIPESQTKSMARKIQNLQEHIMRIPRRWQEESGVLSRGRVFRMRPEELQEGWSGIRGSYS